MRHFQPELHASTPWIRGAAGLATLAGGALLPARAHEVLSEAYGPPTLAEAWTLSPLLLLPLAVFAGLYLAGLWRLWRGGHAGRGVSRGEAAAFVAGLLTLLLATVWPFDALGAWSLAAHMAQHMLLLALAPPLLLAARPQAAVAAALPAAWSRRLHRGLQRWRLPGSGSLPAATFANVAVMGGWHVPAALDLALRHETVHWAMHASFLLAGLWLWRLLWRRIRDDSGGSLAGAVAIVVVMMQMGFLGALLTFSPRVLYPVYAGRAPALGLAALADQQLAGLVMWVPACLPYLVGALWLLAREFGRWNRRPG